MVGITPKKVGIKFASTIGAISREICWKPYSDHKCKPKYYDLEANDESSIVDEKVHIRGKRWQRDIEDDDTMPIYPHPNPKLNPRTMLDA